MKSKFKLKVMFLAAITLFGLMSTSSITTHASSSSTSNTRSANVSSLKWHKSAKGWWFGSNSKTYAKGWKKINNVWYWFNKSGYVNTHKGWEKCKHGWAYSLGANGYYTNTTKTIGGATYNFDTNAYAHKKVLERTNMDILYKIPNGIICYKAKEPMNDKEYENWMEKNKPCNKEVDKELENLFPRNKVAIIRSDVRKLANGYYYEYPRHELGTYIKIPLDKVKIIEYLALTSLSLSTTGGHGVTAMIKVENGKKTEVNLNEYNNYNNNLANHLWVN